MSPEAIILALLPHVEEWKADVITEGIYCSSCDAEFGYGELRAHAPGCELAAALARAHALAGGEKGQ